MNINETIRVEAFHEEIIREVFQELTMFPFISVFHHEGILLQLFKQYTGSIQERVEQYRTTWQYTVYYLYHKYLPHEFKEAPIIGLELTPFTYLLATEFTTDITTEFDLSEDDLNYIQTALNTSGLNDRLLPAVDDRINFFLQVMLVPPLMALSSFYSNAYQRHAQSATVLLQSVGNVAVQLPEYRVNFGLKFANRFISQKTYRTMGGIDGLIASAELVTVAEHLQGLKDSILDNKRVAIDAICPECGYLHDNMLINRDDIIYAHLIRVYSDLHVRIGFSLYESFHQDVFDELENIRNLLNETINFVKNATCVILVEGATEEIAIPEMAIRVGMPLSLQNIRVMSCNSKEKLLETFRQLRNNFPHLKICTLLDSDAAEEKRELEKMIAGHLDQFSLSYITKGAFEDLIPLPIMVETLNELYPPIEGETIQESDFDDNRDIVNQMTKILWMKSKAKLDKVRFIREAVRRMNEDDVPTLIRELIDNAYNLSKIK